MGRRENRSIALRSGYLVGWQDRERLIVARRRGRIILKKGEAMKLKNLLEKSSRLVKVFILEEVGIL